MLFFIVILSLSVPLSSDVMAFLCVGSSCAIHTMEVEPAKNYDELKVHSVFVRRLMFLAINSSEN